MKVAKYFSYSQIVFYCFAWYFDHIFKENRGRKWGYFFFLSAEYWTGVKKEENGELLLDDYCFDHLRVVNISKDFERANCCCGKSLFKALKGIDISASKGEIFTLLGKNGAGKSTLINIMSGILEPTTGDARISGISIVTEDLKGEIGLCPQQDILWDMLTCAEHVELFLSLKGKDSSEAAVLETLKGFNLTEKANSKVIELSGGMKRRMSILLSSIGDPSLIFLDEPTTGLDPVNKRFVWSLIEKLKKGRIIFLTTHSMDEADYLSSVIGIIKEGQIIQMGTKNELKSQLRLGFTFVFSKILSRKQKRQN